MGARSGWVSYRVGFSYTRRTGPPGITFRHGVFGVKGRPRGHQHPGLRRGPPAGTPRPGPGPTSSGKEFESEAKKKKNKARWRLLEGDFAGSQCASHEWAVGPAGGGRKEPKVPRRGAPGPRGRGHGGRAAERSFWPAGQGCARPAPVPKDFGHGFPDPVPRGRARRIDGPCFRENGHRAPASPTIAACPWPGGRGGAGGPTRIRRHVRYLLAPGALAGRAGDGGVHGFWCGDGASGAIQTQALLAFAGPHTGSVPGAK